jgi:spore coat polysaccharide biosynthesis protein SpsF
MQRTHSRKSELHEFSSDVGNRLKIYLKHITEGLDDLQHANALIVIQARLGSTRLPKKLFYEIAGHRLIDHVIHRSLQIEPSYKVVIATTVNELDDELVEYCQKTFPVLITRGDEKNVFNRFEQAINEHVSDEEYLIRITSDDPLRDPALTRNALKILSGKKEAVAIVNRGDFSFPLGVETEICRIEHFLDIAVKDKDDYVNEHIFPYYRKMDQDSCLSLQPHERIQELSLTVDTPEDLEKIDQMMVKACKKFSKNSLELTWQEVASINL